MAPPPKVEAAPVVELSALEAATRRPGPRVPPPSEDLQAAKEFCGVFPLPEGTRFYRKAGRASQFRVVAKLSALRRFYRRYGFVVFDGKGGVSVMPSSSADGGARDDILSIQPRSGNVHVLVVYEGSNPG